MLYDIEDDTIVIIFMFAIINILIFMYGTYRNKISFIDFNLFKDKYFVSIVLLRFFSNICWSVLILFIPVYLQQNYAFTAYEAGIFILITSCVAVIWVFLSDYVVRKWGAYRSLLFPTLCLMLMHLIMLSLSNNPSPLIVMILLITYGFTGLITPTLTKNCLNHIEDKKKGQGMGIYYTFSLLSMGIGGILLGKLPYILICFPFIGRFWNIISIVCISLYVISLIILVFMRKRYSKIKKLQYC